MFGLFKRQVTPDEFGQGVFDLARDFLASDGARSLGMQFDNWDGSQGWGKFLERRSVSIPAQRLHFMLFTHSAVQAACTGLNESNRREVTQGATSVALQEMPAGYDFQSTYATLESIYRKQHQFPKDIDGLSNKDLHRGDLPNPNIAVLNAKFLIEAFVVPNLPNSANFIGGFNSYSAAVGSGLAVVRRGMDYLFNSVKLS